MATYKKDEDSGMKLVRRMLQVLSFIFFVLLSIFCGLYVLYFAYVRRWAKKPWGIKVDASFEPEISILIPVHNEEGVIVSKLENISDVSYPKEKMEIVLADDASGDSTLREVSGFMERNPRLNIKVVKQTQRGGKSAALNKALDQATHSIVVVSDADTQWPPDILRKTMPYMTDTQIGAVTCRGVNRKINESWVTKGEDTYLNFAYTLRLGESKTHSTIRFEGGFCAYRKDAFDHFDTETGADDSGTALEVVQNSRRAIMVPETLFYTKFPTHFLGKLKTKTRRAAQLIGLWSKCLSLLLKRKLLLPKRIAIPEIMLFIFSPLILLAQGILLVITIVLFPFSLFSLFVVSFVGCLLVFARVLFVEVLLDNFILLCGLTTLILGRRYLMWEKS